MKVFAQVTASNEPIGLADADEALIAYQRLQIAKLTRQLYGQRSERSVRLTSVLIAAPGQYVRPRMRRYLVDSRVVRTIRHDRRPPRGCASPPAPSCQDVEDNVARVQLGGQRLGAGGCDRDDAVAQHRAEDLDRATQRPGHDRILLLPKRTRQVFETAAGTAWKPSNRPT
jgi:hypothetical protein